MSINDTAQPNADTQPEHDPTTVQPGTQDAGGGMTQAQIDAIVQSRLAEERRRLQTKYGDLETVAEKAAQFDALKQSEMSELEKLQKALADKDAEVAAAKQAAETERLNALRLRVGQEVGLPPVLVARLQGADEEALKADAEAVKAVLGTGAQAPHIPNTNATAGGSQQQRGSSVKLTPAQRAIADQYGISYDKYAETLQQFEE